MLDSILMLCLLTLQFFILLRHSFNNQLRDIVLTIQHAINPLVNDFSDDFFVYLFSLNRSFTKLCIIRLFKAIIGYIIDSNLRLFFRGLVLLSFFIDSRCILTIILIYGILYFLSGFLLFRNYSILYFCGQFGFF